MNAFATFYSTTKARVLRAVFMATSGRQRSEDAVSEAFVKAYQHWSRLRQHPNPVAGWSARRSTRIAHVADPTARAARGSRAGCSVHHRDVRQRPVGGAEAALSGQREAVAIRVLLDLTTREAVAGLGIHHRDHPIGGGAPGDPEHPVWALL